MERFPLRALLVRVAWTGLLVAVAALLIALSEAGVLSDVWAEIAHEVGFALLVAASVWTLFELQLSMQSERTWARRIERVTQNVFQAVLKKDLPEALMEEARRLVFDFRVIRESFNVAYNLRDAQYEAAPGQQADCVLMVALMTYTTKNVSSNPEVVKIALGLPNPIHPKLRAMVKVESLVVTREGKPVPYDQALSERNFRKELDDSRKTTARYHACDLTLLPHESIDVKAEYVMAKEPEDTELLSTLVPTNGLTLTINDQGAKGARLIFARAVHRRSDVEATSPKLSPETKNFRISDYLLPYQGVLVWWKRVPNGNGASVRT